MSRIFLLGQLITVLVASTAFSQDAKPNARLEAIRPFISDNAIGVAQIELKRLDVVAMQQYFVKMSGDEKFALPGGQRAAELINDLRNAGASTFYLVAEFGNNTEIYAIVPLDEGANVDVILAKVRELPFDFRESKKIGDVVVAGAKDVVTRLQTPSTAQRNHFAAALAAAGDAPVKLVVVPSAVQRQAIEEIVMPTLPKRWGGGSVKLLTRGVLWASVGIELPPMPSVVATVQSEDPKRAKALREFIKTMLLDPLTKQPEIKQFLPGIDALVGKLQPTLVDDRLTLELDAALDFPTLPKILRPVLRAQKATSQLQGARLSLKQIVLAMHNYHDTYEHFPSRAIFDENDKPLLSWRVHVLPFMGESELYNKFKLDEPWDSPHNRELIAEMPSIYRAPASKFKRQSGTTVYVVPVGLNCMFDGNTPITIPEVTDGLSNTVIVLELADKNGVTWTKPDDIAIDTRRPIKPFVGQYPEQIAVAFSDGSVRLLKSNQVTAEAWKAMLLRSDGK